MLNQSLSSHCFNHSLLGYVHVMQGFLRCEQCTQGVLCCVRRYAVQRSAHVDVLARFERDLGALAGAELPRPAQGPGLRRVSDLLPEAQLREWAAQCQAAHGALNDKARPAPCLPVPRPLTQMWTGQCQAAHGTLDVQARPAPLPASQCLALCYEQGAHDMKGLHGVERASIVVRMDVDPYLGTRKSRLV